MYVMFVAKHLSEKTGWEIMRKNMPTTEYDHDIAFSVTQMDSHSYLHDLHDTILKLLFLANTC